MVLIDTVLWGERGGRGEGAGDEGGVQAIEGERQMACSAFALYSTK